MSKKINDLQAEIKQLMRIVKLARKMQYWNVDDDGQDKIQRELWCELHVYDRFHRRAIERAVRGSKHERSK